MVYQNCLAKGKLTAWHTSTDVDEEGKLDVISLVDVTPNCYEKAQEVVEVRSIDEQEPPQPIHEATTPEWVTSPTLKSDDDGSLGGLNHIPGFSSSEEKLLDYNYDSSSSLEGLLVAEAGEYEDEEEGDDDDEVNLANEETDLGEEAEGAKRQRKSRPRLDIVTKLLRIVESQALQGANCTPGTDLNLGDKVVNRYAQERFDQAAHVAVNRANWLTRMWKYAPEVIGHSEYLLHTSIISMVEFNEDIFAAGNCYDAEEYKNYFLFCPYAHRLLDGPILAKDLAIEYKYLSNTSEWFFIARKEAEKVIEMGRSMKIDHLDAFRVYVPPVMDQAKAKKA
eukprot:snap_masked-scaffold380_size190731-processed-gene-0.14 protein:Tk02452 transcript:snap_masked-scaffold380_size190731-processed-gene-0.14-mRNA-1 annotation:"PREDICTED: uncharacterized protein LOC103506221"